MFSSRPRRLEFLIPRNACALWAYYLEIGSQICGITGIPAFITGILGVRCAKRNPQAKERYTPGSASSSAESRPCFCRPSSS